ncbi:MAG: DUF4126 family protein [Gemmatimonadales bacterium]|nr:DUF4126 family protein [Gemmatimonadales bacterium]
MPAWFDTALAVAAGLGLAAACGFRVFVPLLVASAAHRLGHLPLADGMAWLGSDMALAALALATVLEVGAFYVPWLDHALDLAATPAAVLAGIVAAAAPLVDLPPALRWVVAVIGGGAAAGLMQGATVLLRMKSTATTAGAGNAVVATGEVAGALVLAACAVLVPLAALAFAAVLLWFGARATGRLLFGRRARGAAAAALLLLVGVADAGAQAVAPGDAAVDGRRLAAETTRWRWVMVRPDGQESPVGALVDELVRVEAPGGRAEWRRVLSVRRGPSMLVDTTWSDAATLAPRAHRSWQPLRTLAYDVAGARVTGAVSPKGGAPQPIDTTLPGPRFDSGNWDLVARALPLAEGYATALEVWDPDQGATRITLRVTRREAGPGGAWVVVAEIGGAPATLRIDPATRAVLGLDVSMGGGTLRQRREE